MGRHNNHAPKGATIEKTYNGLAVLLRAFAMGSIHLLVILGRPGLIKSRLVHDALNGQKRLIVKGRKSALDFYIDLYTCRDWPVILDDADDLMSQRPCREYVKALTETDQHKRLNYGTRTRILQDEGVAKSFWTTSPVCLITNHWNSHDPIFRALESRAEFIHFDPDWSELYREVGKWFWDQEIFDYVRDRILGLREPDARLFVKAYNRKKANLPELDWRRVINAHIDDELGLVVRRLMDDRSLDKNKDRAARFKEETGADRATFYRRRRQINRYRPVSIPPRILLENTAPPTQPRPADGEV